MRKTIALLALLVAAGCAGASAPKKEDPSSEERSRSTLQVRKELKEIEGELDRLRRDREGWNAIEEDSAEKLEALAEMDVWEKKWMDRRKQLLEALEVAEGSGEAEAEEVPETDAFAALFDAEVATEEQEEEAAEISEEEKLRMEEEKQKAREEEEARRALEEEEKRREEEWARRQAEADALRAAAAALPEEGGEKQLFHEKWSQVILAIQQQLQRYKRW